LAWPHRTAGACRSPPRARVARSGAPSGPLDASARGEAGRLAPAHLRGAAHLEELSACGAASPGATSLTTARAAGGEKAAQEPAAPAQARAEQGSAGGGKEEEEALPLGAGVDASEHAAAARGPPTSPSAPAAPADERAARADTGDAAAAAAPGAAIELAPMRRAVEAAGADAAEGLGLEGSGLEAGGPGGGLPMAAALEAAAAPVLAADAAAAAAEGLGDALSSTADDGGGAGAPPAPAPRLPAADAAVPIPPAPAAGTGDGVPVLHAGRVRAASQGSLHPAAAPELDEESALAPLASSDAQVRAAACPCRCSWILARLVGVCRRTCVVPALCIHPFTAAASGRQRGFASLANGQMGRGGGDPDAPAGGSGTGSGEPLALPPRHRSHTSASEDAREPGAEAAVRRASSVFVHTRAGAEPHHGLLCTLPAHLRLFLHSSILGVRPNVLPARVHKCACLALCGRESCHQLAACVRAQQAGRCRRTPRRALRAPRPSATQQAPQAPGPARQATPSRAPTPPAAAPPQARRAACGARPRRATLAELRRPCQGWGRATAATAPRAAAPHGCSSAASWPVARWPRTGRRSRAATRRPCSRRASPPQRPQLQSVVFVHSPPTPPERGRSRACSLSRDGSAWSAVARSLQGVLTPCDTPTPAAQSAAPACALKLLSRKPRAAPAPRQGRKLAGSLAAAGDRLRGSAQQQVRKVLSPGAKPGAEGRAAGGGADLA